MSRFAYTTFKFLLGRQVQFDHAGRQIAMIGSGNSCHSILTSSTGWIAPTVGCPFVAISVMLVEIPGHQFGQRVNVKGAVDFPDMGVHRVNANAQATRYLLLTDPFEKVHQDLSLAQR